MLLNTEQIYIWQYQATEDDYLAEATTPILSTDEMERANAFFSEIDRMRFIAIHRFVRNVMGIYLKMAPETLAFAKNPFGKPYLAVTPHMPALHFNLSHSGEWALLALAKDCEPGVDIELPIAIEDMEAFQKTYFSKRERECIKQHLQNTGTDITFRFWTFKEAYIKALGTGFNTNLVEIDLADFISQHTGILHEKTWTITPIDAPEKYFAALAYQGQNKEVAVFRV